MAVDDDTPNDGTKPTETPASMQAPVPVEEILEGPALEYLNELLKNIATMLSYANSNGVVLPSDLRGKIDALLNNPAVTRYPARLFPANRRIAERWRRGS